MPNGFHGSEEDWERIEAPLRSLDSALTAFARQYGLRIARSERNWPSRSLHWGDKLERVIQIYLDDSQHLTWNVWICVSQDRHRKRYWKNSFLRKAVAMTEIETAIDRILPEAKQIADGWRSEDLEYATDLSA